MNGLRIIRHVLAVALTSVSAVAQSSGADPGKDPDTLARGPRPYLVSISVADLDRTVKWYQDNLGFVVTKRMALPKYSLRIAFAALNGFQLELIEFKNSVSYEALRRQFPFVDDRAKVQGFGKLAFLVDDLDGLAQRLRKNRVRFERDVTDEKETGQRWFIVTDNSGNSIQFFQDRDAPSRMALPPTGGSARQRGPSSSNVATQICGAR